MTLEYNNGTQGAQAQYNGNVSSILYRMQGVHYTPPSSPSISTDRVGYSFNYDGANRLTGADFRYSYSNQWQPTSSYSAQYTYTGNGNITTAKVYGNADNVLMDDLQYVYMEDYTGRKNRLTYITDAAPPTEFPGDVENQEGYNYFYRETVLFHRMMIMPARRALSFGGGICRKTG